MRKYLNFGAGIKFENYQFKQNKVKLNIKENIP